MANRRKFIGTLGAGIFGSMPIPAFARDIVNETDAMNGVSMMPPTELLQTNEEEYWKLIRQQFPLTNDRIYLNNGTRGPSPFPVIDAVHRWMRDADEQGNYGGWESTAEKLAVFVKADKEEIALTHNVTDGINIVAWGMPLKKGDEVIMTTHEHVGNVGPWMNRARLDGIVVKAFSPAPTAAETLQRINDLITKKTRAIAVPHIPCTQGQILPAKEICKLAKDKGLFSFIDGAHGPGQLQLDLHDMGCDFYASCTHKWVLGPKGTGFLYVRKDMLDTLQALMVGGGGTADWNMATKPPHFDGYTKDAHRYYFGTQNRALYKGVEAAIDFVNGIGQEVVEKRIRGMAKYFQDELLKLEGKIEMLTPTEDKSRGAVVGFRIKSKSHSDFYTLAAEAKIRIRSVPENGLSSLRVSTHIYNNKDEVDKLLELVRSVA